MKRSAIVIAATAAGLALTLSFKPHSTGGTSATLASLTTGTPAVAGAQTVVGSDQALAGGLGDIQVKVTVKNGKLVNVGMAQMNLHGPQSQQISSSVIPTLEQRRSPPTAGPSRASPAPPTPARPTRARCKRRSISSREDPMRSSQQVMGTVVSFNLRADTTTEAGEAAAAEAAGGAGATAAAALKRARRSCSGPTTSSAPGSPRAP